MENSIVFLKMDLFDCYYLENDLNKDLLMLENNFVAVVVETGFVDVRIDANEN